MCKREIRFVDIWFVRHALWYCLDWLRFWATFLHQDEIVSLTWNTSDFVAALCEIPYFPHRFAPFHRRCDLHLGCLRKSGLWALASHIGLSHFQQAGRILSSDKDMRWCFESLTPKCRCLKLLQDRKTAAILVCAKENFPTFLNLVNLAIWQPWRNAEARSHVLCNELLPSSLKKVISSQAQQNKAPLNQEGKRWCIVFGVVVEIDQKTSPKSCSISTCCA